MNCERVQTVLEEYLDGEIDQATGREVDAHVAGCASCAAVLEALEQETAIYSKYDRGIDPGPEMWDAVLARIAQEGPPRVGIGVRVRGLLGRTAGLFVPGRLAPLAAGAFAVVLAASIGFILLRDSVEPNTVAEAPPPMPSPVTPETSVSVPPTDPGKGEVPGVTPPAQPSKSRAGSKPRPPIESGGARQDALSGKVAAVERDYLKAIAVLTKDVTRDGNSIDPKVQKPLDDIDRNILAAREAVQKNPGDPVAVLNMISAYDEKVEVLQTLARFQVDRTR